MEEGMRMEENLTKCLRETFSLPDEVDAKMYSPLTLAFVGDGVYELVNRTVLVSQANAPVNKLNRKSSSLAKASAQAEMILLIMEELTEEEKAVFKRGRNAKSYTMAKNATMHDYRYATGFEALMGYLYLNGEFGRLMALICLGQEKLAEKQKAEQQHCRNEGT